MSMSSLSFASACFTRGKQVYFPVEGTPFFLHLSAVMHGLHGIFFDSGTSLNEPVRDTCLVFILKVLRWAYQTLRINHRTVICPPAKLYQGQSRACCLFGYWSYQDVPWASTRRLCVPISLDFISNAFANRCAFLALGCVPYLWVGKSCRSVLMDVTPCSTSADNSYWTSRASIRDGLTFQLRL